MTKNYFKFDNNLELKRDKNFISKSGKKINSNKIGLAKYMSMGYYLIIPILLGVFSGLFLDNWLKTEKIFFTIFFPVGIFSSFYNLYKIYIDERNRH